MKIDVICNDGSPLQVTEKTIYGDGVQLGVGGAELFLLTMCRAWKERGYDVTLYNNPRELGASSFEQRPLNDFREKEDRDILIAFRSPNRRIDGAKGKKVWLSCDQFTIGDFKEFSTKVDKIVTISPFHAKYFFDNYGIGNSTVIDIPVREWDYTEVVEKNPLQVLYCHIPDRGLDQLAEIWKYISIKVPEAQLHITSDWRLWDASISPHVIAPYRLKFAQFENVTYHSVVSRTELVKLQQSSAINLYPCTYDELFCISVAETQYAGCYPITSDYGALKTTNMGRVLSLSNIQDFVNATVLSLTSPGYTCEMAQRLQNVAQERFGISNILNQWDELVFNG